jgi:2-oxo-4-hydroxy-4-carboxy-5-ureidoimidazoline decarboxylase
MARFMSISTINEMDLGTFLSNFGEVAEDSSWVARQAFEYAPFQDLTALIDAFKASVLNSDVDRQLDLICCHPDLAGKAAIAGELGKDSTDEQKQAGISALSKEEFVRFTDFNTRYKDKFGFPFILAVKGATKEIILDAFSVRLDNGKPEEFKEALKQICRIMQFRLEARVAK